MYPLIIFFFQYKCHPQIDSDDVITREEQIYLLIGAQDACDRSIRNQMALIKGFLHFFLLERV